MKKFLWIAAGLLLLILSACTSLKRFQSARYAGEDPRLVDVTLFHSALKEQEAMQEDKDLWTLSANAQSRLVQILDERYPDNRSFMQALNQSYVDRTLPNDSYTKKDLRLVFAIAKKQDYSSIDRPSGRFSPADRIEHIKVSLELPADLHLTFRKWNRYETAYGELHLGDVSFSRSMNLDAGGDLNAAEWSARANMGRNEKQDLTQRYLQLNGRLSEHTLEFEQEGIRGIDLCGNIMADVALEFKAFPERLVHPLLSDSGLMVLEFEDVLVPSMGEAPDTLFARMKVEYVYRHVRSGWRTYGEWDDRVEYFLGKMEREVPLFLKADYVPSFYKIGTDEDALKYRDIRGQDYLLQFASYGEAVFFLEWLTDPYRARELPVFIGAKQIQFRGGPITPGEILESRMQVRPVY